MKSQTMGWNEILIIVFVVVSLLATSLWRFLPLNTFILVLFQLTLSILAKAKGGTISEVVFGFPPQLVSFQLGGVRYVFNAIPLGSYIQTDMAGGRMGMVILLTGVFTGLLIAWFGLTLSFTQGGHVPIERARIMDISPDAPPGLRGILPGDVIYSIDGNEIISVGDMEQRLLTQQGKEVSFTLLRSGQFITIRSQLNHWAQQGNSLGLQSDGILALKVYIVAPASAASQAGIRAEDSIVTIDGKTFVSLLEVSQYLSQKKGQAVQMIILRNGRLLPPVTLTGLAKPENNQTAYGFTIGNEATEMKLAWLAAMRSGLTRTLEIVATRLCSWIGAGRYTLYPENLMLLRRYDPSVVTFAELAALLAITISMVSMFSILIAFLQEVRGGRYSLSSIYITFVAMILILNALQLSLLDPLRAMVSNGLFGIGNILLVGL